MLMWKLLVRTELKLGNGLPVRNIVFQESIESIMSSLSFTCNRQCKEVDNGWGFSARTLFGSNVIRG